MRTREEQIAAIEEFCGTLGISNDSPDAETIEQWLAEAEQRVRAEIARDSERLDWIGTQDVVIGEYGGKEQWEEVLLSRYQRTLPADLLDIRVTIDAARESNND